MAGSFQDSMGSFSDCAFHLKELLLVLKILIFRLIRSLRIAFILLKPVIAGFYRTDFVLQIIWDFYRHFKHYFSIATHLLSRINSKGSFSEIPVTDPLLCTDAYIYIYIFFFFGFLFCLRFSREEKRRVDNMGERTREKKERERAKRRGRRKRRGFFQRILLGIVRNREQYRFESSSRRSGRCRVNAERSG